MENKHGRYKHGRHERGQLLSVDFLIAVSLLIASLALFTQYLERTQTRFSERVELSTNNAEVIAASLAGEGTLSNPQKYCLQFSNDSKQYDYGACNCPKNIFTARRLTSCENTACVMEVRTCE